MASAERIVVYGAGGHAKVVCDVFRAAGRDVIGFVDDSPLAHGKMVLGLPVLGGGALLDPATHAVALGIGDNAIRARLFEACEKRGLRVVSGTHPRATVAPSAEVGRGTVIMAGVVVNPDAKIGEGVILNTGCIVEHDCVVEAFAHLSPRAALGGAARIGAFVHLGIGASVLPGVAVARDSIVGGGALVARDIPSGVVAYGVPARVSRSR